MLSAPRGRSLADRMAATTVPEAKPEAARPDAGTAAGAAAMTVQAILSASAKARGQKA